MKKNSRIFIAGHTGMVGSAIHRNLLTNNYDNIVTRKHLDLPLNDESLVEEFFCSEKPEFVFLAAAKVGGISANNMYGSDFIRENLRIQTNVIDAAYRHGTKRLLFLGSSCIYPKTASQPIHEDAFLTGPLEETNLPYAVAKIAGKR
jgi:GDP-L-fucose synthase